MVSTIEAGTVLVCHLEAFSTTTQNGRHHKLLNAVYIAGSSPLSQTGPLFFFAPNSPSRPSSNPNRRLSILGSYCLVTSFHFFRSHSLPTILTSLQVFVSNTEGNKYNKICFLNFYLYIYILLQRFCCSKSIEKCMLYISKIHWNLFLQMKYWYNRVFF